MASKPKLVVLRRRSDFEKLRVEGRKLRVSPWLTLIYLESESELRFGWIIPKKVGNAVQRNKIKRWCRVIVRGIEFSSFGADIAVLVGPSKSGIGASSLQFSQFEEALVRGLEIVSQKLHR